jgi:hypothetical protein
MGVVFGKFIPNAEYATIRGQCTSNHVDQSALQLSVRTETGSELQCAAVAILDSAECEGAELNVLGVPHRLYKELFPEHVSSYEKQFKV